nr:unnamed protein product [Naegleria fowleri]
MSSDNNNISNKEENDSSSSLTHQSSSTMNKLKHKDEPPTMISKIDLQNKELIRAMENLPSTHQFLSNLSSSTTPFRSEPSSTLIQMIPDLIQIHRVVHELLPKPNKGLWEPQFNLDPFLLNYMALFYQQQQQQQQLDATNNNHTSISDDGNTLVQTSNKDNHNNQQQQQLSSVVPQRLSKL